MFETMFSNFTISYDFPSPCVQNKINFLPLLLNRETRESILKQAKRWNELANQLFAE